MSTSPSYVCEKLYGAMYALAVGPGRIRERLHSAAMGFHILRPDDFPDDYDLRPQYEQLWKKLTAKKAKADEGTLRATIDAMSEGEAAEIARKLLEIEAQHRAWFDEQ